MGDTFIKILKTSQSKKLAFNPLQVLIRLVITELWVVQKKHNSSKNYGQMSMSGRTETQQTLYHNNDNNNKWVKFSPHIRVSQLQPN